MEGLITFAMRGSPRQKEKGSEGDIFAREKLDEVSLSLYWYFLTLWELFIMKKGYRSQEGVEAGRRRKDVWLRN